MAYRDLYLFQILFCLVIAVCMWFFLKRVFASKHKRKKGKSWWDDTWFYDSSDSSSGDSDWWDDGW